MMEDCDNGSCHECPVSNIRLRLLMPGIRLIDGSLLSYAVMSPCSKILLTVQTEDKIKQSNEPLIEPSIRFASLNLTK